MEAAIGSRPGRRDWPTCEDFCRGQAPDLGAGRGRVRRGLGRLQSAVSRGRGLPPVAPAAGPRARRGVRGQDPLPRRARRVPAARAAGSLRPAPGSLLPAADLVHAVGVQAARRRTTRVVLGACAAWPAVPRAGARPSALAACAVTGPAPAAPPARAGPVRGDRPCWPGWPPASTLRAAARPVRAAGSRPCCLPADGAPGLDLLADCHLTGGGASVCVLSRMVTGTPSPTATGPAEPPGGRAGARIGIGGPVGSGKTALVAALCRALRRRAGASPW